MIKIVYTKIGVYYSYVILELLPKHNIMELLLPKHNTHPEKKMGFFKNP